MAGDVVRVVLQVAGGGGRGKTRSHAEEEQEEEEEEESFMAARHEKEASTNCGSAGVWGGFSRAEEENTDTTRAGIFSPHCTIKHNSWLVFRG